MTGVLEGYRVLEFGDYIAPQVLGMLLADQGAEVVKIEPPTGGRLRGAAPFAVWNRSKKSVTLDASADTAPRIISQLAASADIPGRRLRDTPTRRSRNRPPSGKSPPDYRLPARIRRRPPQRRYAAPRDHSRRRHRNLRRPRHGRAVFHLSPSRQHLRRAHRRAPPSSPLCCTAKPPAEASASTCPYTTPCSARWVRR